MGAAIDFGALLDAVAHNSAIAMRADRRHSVNGTFEAIEGLRPALLRDLERLVVIVAACVTLRHGFSSSTIEISDYWSNVPVHTPLVSDSDRHTEGR
jgi:hypothetical protein